MQKLYLMAGAIMLALGFLVLPSQKATAAYPVYLAAVPGAPVGGPTGTGGNAGVGDYDAGEDRANSTTPASSSLSRTATSNNYGNDQKGYDNGNAMETSPPSAPSGVTPNVAPVVH